MDKHTMRTFWTLFHLTLLVEELVRRLCRKDGFAVNEVAVLAALSERGSLDASHIARIVGRSRQNVQRTLETLERRDYIVATRYPETERAAYWSITELGDREFGPVRVSFSRVCTTLRQRMSNFEPTITNLEVMIDELAAEQRSSWVRLGLKTIPPKKRELSWKVSD